MSFIQNDTIKDKPIYKYNNIIKANYLIFNQPALSIQYERKLFKKITASVTLTQAGKQEFLFLKLYRTQFARSETMKNQLLKITNSYWSISPEVRLYLGTETFKGFYLSPFINYTKFNMTLPLDIIEDEVTEYYQEVHFNGKGRSLTAGISIGGQWKIYKRFYIDWLIAGPNVGLSEERLKLNSDLSQRQQKALTKSLETFKSAYEAVGGIPKTRIDYEVNSSGADMIIKNPWFSSRFELAIGYRLSLIHI